MTQTLRYDFLNNPSLVPDTESPSTTPDLSITRATLATVVKSDGLIHEVSAGVARFTGATYSGDTASGTSTKGLLVEEARTNIARASEDITNGTYWSTHPDTLAFVGNEAIAPDGSQTGDLIIDDSGGGTSTNVRASHPDTYSTSTAYTVSLYIKAGGLDWARMDISAMGALSLKASFDLTNGVVGATVGSDVTSTFIQDAGNGWYRCGFTFISDATDTTGTMDVRPANGNDNVTVDRDGTSSIYVWGLQIEAGAFPTSYISNNSATASVTRNADDVSTTDVSWYDTSGGSFYTHVNQSSVVSTSWAWEMTDGTSNTSLRLGLFSDRVFWVVRNAGTTTVNISTASGTADEAKFAAAVATNDAVLYDSGSLVGTDTSVTLPSGLDGLTIGRQDWAASQYINGHIAEIRYYDERLINANLENLSNGLFPIPDVVGLSEAGAETLLLANGFVVATASASSETVAVGNVISQDGAAGTYAAGGATVTVTISTGSAGGNAGGWLNEYNAYKQRKREQERKRKEILQKVRALDGIDGEIAELMQLDQAKEEEDKRIAEFRQLLDSEISKAELDKAGLLNARINRAYDRAMQKATFSAIEALEREIEDAIEEEDFLFIVMSIQ